MVRAGDVPRSYTLDSALRAMLNDESEFPEPEAFHPERFLTHEGRLRSDDNVPDPVDILFGFGRRYMIWVKPLSQR